VPLALPTLGPPIGGRAQASTSRLLGMPDHLPIVASPALVIQHRQSPPGFTSGCCLHCASSSLITLVGTGSSPNQSLPHSARCLARAGLWRPAFRGARFLKCVPSLRAGDKVLVTCAPTHGGFLACSGDLQPYRALMAPWSNLRRAWLGMCLIS
jgi:hypothetical protein